MQNKCSICGSEKLVYFNKKYGNEIRYDQLQEIKSERGMGNVGSSGK